MKKIQIGIGFLIWGFSFNLANAVSINLISDFEDGTTMGWQKGEATAYPPTIVEDTDGNHFLKVESFGGKATDSRMAFFNLTDWRGNYNAAGIGSMQARMKNMGKDALYMRLGFPVNIADEWHFFISKAALELPVDNQWYDLSFGMNEEHIKIFPRSANYTPTWRIEDGMSAIRKPKFVSSKDEALFWGGDQIVATLGVDDISASTEVLQAINLSISSGDITPVPLPVAIWLFASGLLGMAGVSGFKKSNRKSFLSGYLGENI